MERVVSSLLYYYSNEGHPSAIVEREPVVDYSGHSGQ